MSEFNPQISGIGSKHSANWTTTTAHYVYSLAKLKCHLKLVLKYYVGKRSKLKKEKIIRPKKLVLVYLRNIFCKFFSLLSFDRLLRSTASIAVTEINFSITGIRTWGGPNENCLSNVTTIDHTANQTSQLLPDFCLILLKMPFRDLNLWHLVRLTIAPFLQVYCE